MKLTVVCGGCRKTRDVEMIHEDNITQIIIPRCPNCGRQYRDFYDTLIGLHDETATNLDDVRKAIHEQMVNAPIAPKE